MIRRLINKIRSLFPYFRSFYVYEVKSHVIGVESYPILFKQVVNDNIWDVISFRDENIVEQFVSFLLNDEFGLYGYYQGEVIVHGWATINKSSRNELVNGYFLLPPKAAFIHFCSVNPKYRGKKVYQALLLELYKSLKLDGYVIYIDTNDWNIAAQKAIEHTGAEFIYCLKTFWLLNRCLIKFIQKNE